MIEDKENLDNQSCQVHHNSTESGPRTIQSTISKQRKTRPIKRCKRSRPVKGMKKSKKAMHVNKKEKENNQNSTELKNSTICNNEKNEVMIFREPKKDIKKVAFDPSFLPQSLRQLYENKKKLKNTDLMKPGIKFVKDPSVDIIQKWEKAIIVYQKTYKENQRCHFGLLIKLNQRIITFDGVTKLWPIQKVQKSFHWISQPDTWSCGYRVLFWISQISKFGLERWVEEFENARDPEVCQCFEL